MAKTNFPWHLSNIVDTSSSPAAQTSTSEEPQEGDAVVPGTQRYTVLNVKGVRVGIIGLVEKDWLATLPSLPSEFRYRSMASVAVALSQELRDPEGEACELIVALTHSRVQNDIALANAVGATKGSADGHGVDIVLGGHDHTYYIGRGADSFEGEAFERPGGTDEDQACFIIKVCPFSAAPLT
jgi:2',3'-cyclic-nucleotide 2'-phosphodiesterase (5'-nucleotidase family)